MPVDDCFIRGLNALFETGIVLKTNIRDTVTWGYRGGGAYLLVMSSYVVFFETGMVLEQWIEACAGGLARSEMKLLARRRRGGPQRAGQRTPSRTRTKSLLGMWLPRHGGGGHISRRCRPVHS